jgi:hypothetical protein
MTDSSEHNNEASGFINDGELLEYLSLLASQERVGSLELVHIRAYILKNSAWKYVTHGDWGLLT